MTTFSDLPSTEVPGIRWVGSTVMDEEQFTVEGWFEDRGSWRCTLAGLQRYAQLRRQRREDRARTWAERNAEDESFTEYVNALEDAKPQP